MPWGCHARTPMGAARGAGGTAGCSDGVGKGERLQGHFDCPQEKPPGSHLCPLTAPAALLLEGGSEGEAVGRCAGGPCSHQFQTRQLAPSQLPASPAPPWKRRNEAAVKRRRALRRSPFIAPLMTESRSPVSRLLWIFIKGDKEVWALGLP